MSFAVALDILVAILLVATIAYAIILNRKLAQLRGGAADMERLVSDFYQATTRAESSLTALKEAAGGSDPGLAGQAQALSGLRDELAFLVERAESQSARLEELIREGRGAAAPGLSDPAPDGARDTAHDTKPAMAPDAALDAELFAAPGDTVQEVR